MDTIEINGQIFPYESMELAYENAIPLDKKIAKENLLLLKKVLDNNGCEFILTFGTLLGAVRDNDFITHDTDIDVAVFGEESIFSCIYALWEEGLHLCRYESSSYISFIRKNIYIDVYIVKNVRFPLSLVYCHYAGMFYPKNLLKKTQDYPFLETHFKVPLKLEQNLVHVYGKTWKIPRKGDLGNIESLTIRIIRKIMQHTPRFLQNALKSLINS